MNQPPADDATVLGWLRRTMALFTGLLVAATWPLWTPGGAIPDIPWLGICCRLTPGPGEIAMVANLAVFLLLQFLSIRRRWLRWGLNGWFFCTSVPILLLLDQHRLQPWAWQMLLGAALITFSATPSGALQRLRWLTLSIYVWSAISKLDWAFLEGHGQLLLQGLAEAVGLSPQLWSESVRQALASLFPVGELAVALALLVPRWRRVGRWGATLMHVGLLVALGPAGLGHEWGVLIWNVFFIINIWLLFGDSRRSSEVAAAEAPESDPDEVPRLAAVSGLTGLICLIPALSLVGWWDWWPGWAVYSSRPAIVQLQVQVNDSDRLPASLQPFVGVPAPLSEWAAVNMDGWSYATCWCPTYPQLRYRLAVIAAVVAESDVDARVIVRLSPDRWTGIRTEQILDQPALAQHLDEFLLNTRPRAEPAREAFRHR